MSETIKNRGGRPRVDATPLTVRVPPEMLSAIDDIASGQELSRPETVRVLVKQALVDRGYLKADQ